MDYLAGNVQLVIAIFVVKKYTYFYKKYKSFIEKRGVL